ncbi:TetR/AcrR family transcriptional regulator [Wenzhouxiangella sp. EGI_FJ10409]|uniref:TetR/AcrR family transcriptional regulator n=1 Tax=Wenzhouxiangella sp. EGI_FJ10409 TaxID=3243767 RepID=UPI0035D8A7EC
MGIAASHLEDAPSGHQRLLEAAAACFASGGYAGTSIAGIARAAGMSKSTVFHHFPSKEALYLAVIGEAVADFGQRLDHALSVSGDIATALKIFQREHIHHMQRHRQVVRLILRELQDPALEHKRPLIIELLSTNFTRLVRRLEAARQEGRVRSTANGPVAALVLFATNAFFFQHAGELAELPGLQLTDSPDDFAEAVIDVLYNGLAPQDTNGAET